MINRFSRVDVLALVVIALFGGLALTYARAMPPFENADEGAHFLYTHNLLATGELPRILSREQIATQTEATQRWAIETHQPPLYYAIGSVLIFWTDRGDIDEYLRPNDLIFIRGITADNHNQWLHSPTRGADGQTGLALMILRGYSIALGMATLWFIYLTARLIFPRTWSGAILSLLTIAFTASIPTFVAISAAVNNDNLVTTLYAAGVYWSLRLWHRGEISRVDTLALSLILALIALTKLNGVTLFGVVYVALLIGVWRNYIPRRDALRLMGMSLLVAAIFAGWWYVRNLDLYGDPLALNATQSLWGREFEIAATSGDIGAELGRIYRSFWLMIGYLHLPVYAPNWFYETTTFFIGLAGIGLSMALVVHVLGRVRRKMPESWFTRMLTPKSRKARELEQNIDTLAYRKSLDSTLLLCFVIVVVTVTLLIGTRNVDISYGRLLFPALVGFSPLMVLGWSEFIPLIPMVNLRRVWQIMLVVMCIFTLTWISIETPRTFIADAYPALEIVDSLPEGARAVNVDAEGLTILAYTLQTESVVATRREQQIHFDLYLRGNHPETPALFVTVIDTLTQERYGHAEVFPGNAPTDALDPDLIYRAHISVTLDGIDSRLTPRRLDLRLEWYSPSTFRSLDLVDGGGTPIDALIVPASTLIGYSLLPLDATQTDVTFGEAIRLSGFDLSHETAQPGETVELTLYWESVARLDEDFVTAVQIIGADGEILTQADGQPAGYPTSAWRHQGVFIDERTLTLPADAPEGEYRILIGWYRLSDFMRLVAVGEGVQDNLFTLPVMLTIGSP